MTSHARATAAIAAGHPTDEIVPISVPQRKGDLVVVKDDEGVRAPTTMQSLGALRPGLDKNGTVTAGQISASLLHLPSRAISQALMRAALKLGVLPLVDINEAFAA